MVQPTRIIIDTDPGVDDVFALLSALSASPQELELLLISITHGNVDAQNCLRNIVTLFDILRREREWRRQTGKVEEFQLQPRPLVAFGAQGPLSASQSLAQHVHGRDGLGGVHTSHPHLTPPETWRTAFQQASEGEGDAEVADTQFPNFRPSKKPSHKEILTILRENPPNTITIVAIGPLTNIALAALEDQETLLRVKEIVVMGGAIDVPGNITPVAEFNTYADPHAASVVFSLTRPTRVASSDSESESGHAYGGLSLRLFPLDITLPHKVRKSRVLPIAIERSKHGSPLGEWMEAILGHTFERVAGLGRGDAIGGDVGITMHDPLCMWYVLTQGTLSGWKSSSDSPEDIRIETDAKWTRGMCVVDRRGRKRSDKEQPGDRDGWLNILNGNRVWRMKESPGVQEFEDWITAKIFPPLDGINGAVAKD